jgi:hypothetical protein
MTAIAAVRGGTKNAATAHARMEVPKQIRNGAPPADD